jgi:putative Ca2+/H+ antiporter (TMEM165/GDT1 family)
MGIAALIMVALGLLAPFVLSRSDATRLEWAGVLLAVFAGIVATLPAVIMGTTDTPFLPYGRVALYTGAVLLFFSAGRRLWHAWQHRTGAAS